MGLNLSSLFHVQFEELFSLYNMILGTTVKLVASAIAATMGYNKKLRNSPVNLWGKADDNRNYKALSVICL